MKLFGKIFLGVIIILAVLGLIFQKKIKEIIAVKEYAASFEADKIQSNFRSMHERYPSQKIDAPEDTFVLKTDLRDDILSIPYVYNDVKSTVGEFISRTETTGFTVLQGDQIVHEEYGLGNDATSNAIQMSVTKSFVSTLLGIALEEGFIDSVNDQVVKYVPELVGSAYDGVTIEQVLEMSSGVRWNEDYGDLNSDLVQSIVAVRTGSLNEFTAKVPREIEPGTDTRYASIDTQVLGMVVEAATKQDFKTYFKEKIWDKLGAEGDAYLLQDTVGTGLFYGGLNIRLRDMARFGVLMLNQGVNYKGESVVSSEWVKKATTPDKEHLMPLSATADSYPRFGYKYQWWIPNDWDGDDFSAIGIYGQYIYINPSRNVVIAKTSAYKNYLIDGGWMNVEALAVFQAIARHLSTDAAPSIEAASTEINATELDASAILESTD